jgi:hypothetical protein
MEQLRADIELLQKEMRNQFELREQKWVADLAAMRQEMDELRRSIERQQESTQRDEKERMKRDGPVFLPHPSGGMCLALPPPRVPLESFEAMMARMPKTAKLSEVNAALAAKETAAQRLDEDDEPELDETEVASLKAVLPSWVGDMPTWVAELEQELDAASKTRQPPTTAQTTHFTH